MSRQPFRISKDSIEIPYRRFLADSSAGFLLMLLMAVAYYYPLFADISPKQMYGASIVGPEVKVFLLVLGFLLATPIGFAINAVTWFLLSQSIDAIERLAFRQVTDGRHHVFVISDIAASRNIAKSGSCFGVDRDNFGEQTSFLRQALENPVLESLTPEMNVRGLLIFLRNAVMFSFLVGVISLGVANPCWWRTLALIALSLLSALTLVVSWTSHKNMSLTFAAISTLLFVSIAVTAGVNRFTAQGLSMIAVSAVILALAGVIGFYNSCAVILHAYFAAVATGVELDPDIEQEKDPKKTTSLYGLLKITTMIRVAARRSLAAEKN